MDNGGTAGRPRSWAAAGLDERAEAATARIEAQVRQAQEHAAAMRAWAGQLERITGEGTALRGGVRVSVSNTGVLTALQLTDAAPVALARAILEALEAAKQAVADQTARSAVSQFGADAELTRLMVDDLGRRLGVTPDPTGPGAAAAGRDRRDGVLG